jgi:hypothetical protein
MTMRGNELVSLLGAFVSGLEESILTGGPAVSPPTLLLTGTSSIQPQAGESELAAYGIGSGKIDFPKAFPSDSTSTEDSLKAALGGSSSAYPHLSSTPGSVSLVEGLSVPDQNTSYRSSALIGGPALAGLSEFLDVFRQSHNSTRNDFAFPRYSEQSRTHISEGISGPERVVVPTDYGHDGLPRSLGQQQTVAPRVDVRIEALDARSFLDRKEDIAEAVRQAMLTSGVHGLPLNEY